MLGLKFRWVFLYIVLILFINHIFQSEETRNYISAIFEEIPYSKDIYSKSSDFYIIHLQAIYSKWRILTNNYYAVLSAKFDEIPGSQNIKYFIKDVYSDIKPEVIQFFSYIDFLMIRIYKKYVWKSYIYSRIYLYADISPYIKKHIHTLISIDIPMLYESMKLKIQNICCTKIPFYALSFYNKYSASTRTFYTNSVPPAMKVYIDIIHNNFRPIILPVYAFLATSMVKFTEYANFFYSEFLKKNFVLVCQYLYDSVKFYSGDYYVKIVDLYYDIFTSDPLDEEIIRLYSLLDIYESVTATSIIATITTTSTIYRQKTDAVGFSNPLDDFTEKVINSGHNKDELSPVNKKLSIWESLIVDTGKDVLADVDATFLEEQRKYIDNGFKSLLESNIKDLNDYITKSYTEIQTYIKNIDSADIYMTNENLIINDFILKTPKFKNHNKDLKFFKNVYLDSEVDSFGLNLDNYIQLIDEVDYMNDLLYNKTMIQKSRDDMNFPDREFFLEHVLEGKDIDVSFGKVNYPETIEVNEFQLLTPGQYLVTSDLLKRVTISNGNRNVISKVTRKLVRDAFTRVRTTIEDKASIIHQIIENAFYEVLEDYNKIKFKNLDAFEDFCDIILEEWDKKFLEFLEAEEQKNDQYLFDDQYDHIEGDSNRLSLEEEEENKYIGESEIIETFNSEKLEDRKKIRSAHCWKTYKKFYEIKNLLLDLRDKLNNLPPNWKEMQSVTESVGKTVFFLLSESNQYLDLLRAQANLEFQFREEFDFKERVRRYENVNVDKPEILEEKKLREQTLKMEHDKFMNRLLDGFINDGDAIQKRLGLFKNADEIIEELENNDNIEYYYDTAIVEVPDEPASKVDAANTIEDTHVSQTRSITVSKTLFTTSTIFTKEPNASSKSKTKASTKPVVSSSSDIINEVSSAASLKSSDNTKSIKKSRSAKQTQDVSTGAKNHASESVLLEEVSESQVMQSKESIKLSSNLSEKVANTTKTPSLQNTPSSVTKYSSSLAVQKPKVIPSETLGLNANDKEEIFEESAQSSSSSSISSSSLVHLL